MDKYSDCFYCKGEVKEEFLPREIRWKGQLYIFEDVPIGVCLQCKEKFIKPEVAKIIDEMLTNKNKPKKIIEVPVYDFKTAVA